MDGRDKVDLALRGGLIAASALQLMHCNSKTLAKLIRNETAKLFMDLDKKIDALPEDTK